MDINNKLKNETSNYYRLCDNLIEFLKNDNLNSNCFERNLMSMCSEIIMSKGKIRAYEEILFNQIIN